MESIRVQAEKGYDVLIGAGLLKRLGETLDQRHKPGQAVVVSDENVDAYYGKQVRDSLSQAGIAHSECTLSPGEATKSMDTLSRLLEAFAQRGVTSSDLILAVGGGVIGDVAGFAAAVYMRGTPYVQVPTTLLAAVDSSVGGKTAVNLSQGKNLAGAFWQPSMVLCDTDTFQTLPEDIYRDGLAEIVKYAILEDEPLFRLLSSGGGLGEHCERVVAKCVAIKAAYVAEDERDKGRRRMLNLGHTMGHALERLSGFSIPHGHAVAAGIAGAARIAQALGICSGQSAADIIEALRRLRLPVSTSYEPDAIAQAALSDKKRTGATITLVLPRKIGDCIFYETPVEGLREIFRLAF